MSSRAEPLNALILHEIWSYKFHFNYPKTRRWVGKWVGGFNSDHRRPSERMPPVPADGEYAHLEYIVGSGAFGCLTPF